MNSSLKKNLLFLFKLCLAAAVLVVLARTGLLDLKTFRNVILDGWPWVLCGFAAFFFNLGITGWRWNLLLRAQGIRIPFSLAMRLTYIGQFFSTFMPGATGGDLVKAYYIYKRGENRAGAVTTVFLDRVIGIYCMIFIAAMMVLIRFNTLWAQPESRPLAIWIPIIFFVVTAFFVLLFTPQFRKAITATRTGPPIPFGQTIYKIYRAVDLYRDAKSAVIFAFLISLFANVINVFALWSYGKALGEQSLTVGGYILVVPLGLVANGLPLLPMGLGQGEAAFEMLFQWVAGSPNGAEVAVLMHLVVLTWSALCVFFYLGMRADLLEVTVAGESSEEEFAFMDEEPARPAPIEYSGRQLHDYSGSLHFHTRYSDGSDSMQSVIRQAKMCALDFLVVTDHDTMQARTDGWEGWHYGVLNIVAVEITSIKGHCLALGLENCEGLEQMSPPDYLKEVRARKALSFVAHPSCRPRPNFKIRAGPWSYWDCPDFDGIEVWSYMHDWMAEVSLSTLLRRVLNPLGLISGPEPELLERWDSLGAERKVVGIGGTDNHARNLPFRTIPLYLLKVLPYRFAFQTIRTHVLSEEFAGEDQEDIHKVISALRDGHCYLAYDYLASSSGFLFRGEMLGKDLLMGDETVYQNSCHFLVRSPVVAELSLLRDGEVFASAEGKSLEVTVDGPGVYRVEARLQTSPWVFTNPIYLRNHSSETLETSG